MSKFILCHYYGRDVYLRKSSIVGVTQNGDEPRLRKVYTIGEVEGWNIDETIDWLVDQLEGDE